MPKGRPKGSKNKPKEVPKKTRGRPVGSKSIPQPADAPKIDYTIEIIHGFSNILQKWGDKGYMIYQVSTTSMELKAEDMLNAVQKYVDRCGTLPTRAVLHKRNEKLLPYLNAQAPNIEICLTVGGTALWEIQFQIP